MKKTLRQNTIKADIDFIDKVFNLQAEIMKNERRRISVREVTRDIVKCESFKDLEKELLNNSKRNGLKIKFDKRRLFE